MASSANNEASKYEVVKSITLFNSVPEGARMANIRRTFKVGEILEGGVHIDEKTNQSGFLTTGRYFFPFDNKGKNENIKRISKIKDTTRSFTTPSTDGSSINTAIQNLEKTKKIHYLLVGGSIIIGGGVGLGVAAMMNKSGGQKLLFTMLGVTLAVVPTMMYLTPIYKDINIKLKNLEEI